MTEERDPVKPERLVVSFDEDTPFATAERAVGVDGGPDDAEDLTSAHDVKSERTEPIRVDLAGRDGPPGAAPPAPFTADGAPPVIMAPTAAPQPSVETTETVPVPRRPVAPTNASVTVPDGAQPPPRLAPEIPLEAGVAPEATSGINRARQSGRALWRHRRPIGATFVVLAVLGLGATGGWYLRGMVDDEEEVAINVDRPIVAPEAAVQASEGAPNLLGLDRSTTRQALFDAGVTADEITFEEVPAAGTPGRVVTQDPNAGVPVEGPVTVGLSTPADMPDLVGQSQEAAADALDALGARVLVRSAYSAGSDEGTVLTTEPAAGQVVPVEVVVTIASAPSSVYLADLEAVESDCGTGDAQIAGDVFVSSLLCDAYSDGASMAYLPGGSMARVDATLGQIDESEPGTTVRYVMIADGRTVIDETVPYGEAREVSADLSGAVRLDILLSFPGGDDCCADVTAALGSARFVGAPDAVDRLVAEAASS